jgi:hypothetical protein
VPGRQSSSECSPIALSETSALPRRASKQARDVAKPGTQPAPQTTGATQGHAQVTHNCAHYRQAITRKSGAPIGRRCAPRLQATAATLSDTVLNDHRRPASPNTGCPALVTSPRPGGTDRRYGVELNWQGWVGCGPGEVAVLGSSLMPAGPPVSAQDGPADLPGAVAARRARAQLGGDAAALASAQARASAASSIATSAWSTAQAA